MWFKKISLLAAASVALNAASYTAPVDYDDYRASVLSSGYGVITSTSPFTSANTYQIGGRNAKYACIQVPKIPCHTGAPSIVPNMSEASIRDAATNLVLNLWTADLRVEEDASNWYICGGLYGGEKSDYSEFNTIPKSDGSIGINYRYVPNVNLLEEFALIKSGGGTPASSTSFMTIQYQQICR